MLVIPVIDVRHGVAVRAVAGDRANYRPLETPLAATSAPEAVAGGFMALHPFPVIYIADLDGIEKRGADGGLPGRVLSAGAGFEVWVDSGAASPEDVVRVLSVPRVHAVLGSESGWTCAGLLALPEGVRARSILSLDFRGGAFQGEPDLLTTPDSWPDRVIAMTLSRVGRGEGPDVARIAGIRRLIEGRSRRGEIFAAGGVRGLKDLEALARAGVAGALVASALHAGALTKADIAACAADAG